MKHLAVPAFLVQSQTEGEARLASLGNVKLIQVDVLDQTLIKNSSWSDPAFFRTKPGLDLELHLMVADPLAYMKLWRRIPTVKRVYWHVEAEVDHTKLIAYGKKAGWEVGLALNPTTPLATLVPYLRSIDCVMTMGVTPGWSGQTLQRRALQNLSDLRKLSKRIKVAFDGGVTLRNARGIAKRGAVRICLASALFKTPDPAKTLLRLQKTLNTVH